MALLVNFTGFVYATGVAEGFYGSGNFDTVSYEKAPSIGSVGSYDLGVTVDLANPSLNTGWAWGDKFYFGTVEKIIGSQYTDYLYGDAQANTFDGGGSPDFLYGRDGNDSLMGGGGFDYLYGGFGNDVLDGQWHTDTLYGEDGNDQLHGDARLPSSSSTPTEYYAPFDFMPGSDEIHGGTGNDVLNGDGGNDKLWGDGGADRFKFDAPYTVKDAAGADMRITSGDDVIMDFHPTEGDRLNFSGQYTVKDTSGGMV